MASMDNGIIERLWTEFQKVAEPQGVILAEALRAFENGGPAQTVAYHPLVMGLALSLMAVCDQPGAGELVAGLGYDILGIGESRGLCCLSDEARNLYETWWLLQSCPDGESEAEGDHQDARMKARTLLGN